MDVDWVAGVGVWLRPVHCTGWAGGCSGRLWCETCCRIFTTRILRARCGNVTALAESRARQRQFVCLGLLVERFDGQGDEGAAMILVFLQVVEAAAFSARRPRH